MHDLAETLAFDRVLVVQEGRVVEDGAPAELAAREGSAYRALLDEEELLRHALTGRGGWRRLVLEDGALRERTDAPPALAERRRAAS